MLVLAGIRWPASAYPLGFDFSNMAQRHALYVERAADKAVLLSDRVQLSRAEARIEGIVGGSTTTGVPRS